MGTCSICGAPLGEGAVTFTAGGYVLFRPCEDCADKARSVLRGTAELGASRLKLKLQELVPPEARQAASKAVRIAKIFAEED